MWRVGQHVEIKPAYNSETGDRDIWDEVAGCCGQITWVNRDDTVEVQILNGYETNIHVCRLKADPYQ